MDLFQYETAAVIILMIFCLVVSVEQVSNRLRHAIIDGHWGQGRSYSRAGPLGPGDERRTWIQPSTKRSVAACLVLLTLPFTLALRPAVARPATAAA